MKSTKRWLALLLAGLLTIPNATVLRAEELTDGAVAESFEREAEGVAAESLGKETDGAVAESLGKETDGAAVG